jgi:hypothetical protein
MQLYPDELERIAVALTKLANAFEFTSFTDTNKAIFNIAVSEEFAKIGLTARVNWQEICTAEGPTGVWLPGVEPTGRLKPESETDHDRMRDGIVKGLDGGPKSYIRENNTITENPIKRIIT